jgi:competence protein ComEA
MNRKLAPVFAVILALGLCQGFADDSETTAGVVNINQASIEQLQLLPRIGPSLSQRIVDFREENGPFASVDELIAVNGIGERSLEDLRPYVSLEGGTTLEEKVRLPRAPRD